jgi:hypothetical protein
VRPVVGKFILKPKPTMARIKKLLARNAHAFASVEPINRREFIYSIVAKIARRLQRLLLITESAWWVGFVTFVFENHNISPLLSGLDHNDLAGFVDVCVLS